GIGLTFGFKVEFLSIGLFALCIAILCSLFLPSVPGEKRSQANSPLTMLKNSGVQLVLLLTFLGVAANYGLYTFITNLVADISYSGISSAQIFFGVGSIISVGLAMRYLDHRLHLLVSGMFGTGLVTM
ncbi:MFS transporter, partial [Veillonellaceae bacterium M2-8]|nr:MFS transporter [Veillonellaceae bacterium M2-8]